MSATWSLKCTSGLQAGTEQSLAAWGLQDSKIERMLHGADQATFRAIVADATANLAFAFGDRATVYRTDTSTGKKVPWFAGVWTKPRVKLFPDDESLYYQLSGPWWYLGRLAAQVPWQALGVESGVTVTSQFLAQLNMGQSPDGTQLNLGAAITELLQYVISACQSSAQAVPFTPFIIGDIVPATIVPYQGIINMTCEQFLIEMLRWIPDAQPNFDYSTVDQSAPGDSLGAPTLHIGLRSTLPAAMVSAKFAPNNGNDITPRNDLLVPGVVIKYQEENTVDGNPELAISVDAAPATANEQTLGTMCITVNLQGGSATYQKQPVKVHDRPISAQDNDARNWVESKLQNIFAQSAGYDTANIGLLEVTSAFDPNDPATMRPPSGDINELSAELVTGSITEWMNQNQDVYAAYIDVTVTLIYKGNDPKTLALFADANSPGVMVKTWRMTATNASTQTYVQLASLNPPETPPVGLAAYLYAGLSQLHYQGSVELTEDDCSGLVKMANTLNLCNGRPEWASMAAQVIRVTEELDHGITTVQFGPPERLGISELMDIYRVTRVRQPPYNANAQQTGNASSTDIKGHTYAAGTSEIAKPSMGVNNAQWGLQFRRNPDGSWSMRINPKSFIGTDSSTAGQLYCAGVGVWVTISAADTIVFLVGTVSNLVTQAITAYVGPNGQGFDTGAAPWTANAAYQDDGGNPPNQTVWRKKIADIDWSSGSPVALPAVNAPLIIKNGVAGTNSEPCIYPY